MQPEKSTKYEFYRAMFPDKYHRQYDRYKKEQQKQKFTEKMWDKIGRELTEHFKLDRVSAIFAAWLQEARKTDVFNKVKEMRSTHHYPMDYNYNNLTYHSEVFS
jgi:hypothetical protein